jgi:hypothetical protein
VVWGNWWHSGVMRVSDSANSSIVNGTTDTALPCSKCRVVRAHGTANTSKHAVVGPVCGAVAAMAPWEASAAYCSTRNVTYDHRVDDPGQLRSPGHLRTAPISKEYIG